MTWPACLEVGVAGTVRGDAQPKDTTAAGSDALAARC
jgi:hypothetical protein